MWVLMSWNSKLSSWECSGNIKSLGLEHHFSNFSGRILRYPFETRQRMISILIDDKFWIHHHGMNLDQHHQWTRASGFSQATVRMMSRWIPRFVADISDTHPQTSGFSHSMASNRSPPLQNNSHIFTISWTSPLLQVCVCVCVYLKGPTFWSFSTLILPSFLNYSYGHVQ